MRIVIVGVGAMGCLLGARLQPHAQVMLAGHWPEQIAAIARNGLYVEHPDGTHTRHVLTALALPAALPMADIALVAVKSRQTAGAAQAIARFLAPDGLAVTLQNGLNNRATLRASLGPERVTLGVTSEGATVVAPGRVRHAGHGVTHLGRDTALEMPQRARLEKLAEIFCAAGFDTRLVDDTDGLVWGKLAVNAAINPLTALLRVPNGFLLEQPALVNVMSRVASEVAAVAASRGITLPYPDAAARALDVARATAANRSSMLQDVDRGAPTEIDAICGAVVRAGGETGIPTPLNTRLWQLVHQLETGYVPFAPGNVAGLLDELPPLGEPLIASR